MNSLFPVFLSDDLGSVTEFYVANFGFVVVFEADWYVQLHYQKQDAAPLELAFMLPNLEVMPEPVRAANTHGVVLTLDFDDVDAVYERLKKAAAVESFLLDPIDEDWGQRHFMFVDPGGLTVDVVQAIAPAGEYAPS